MFGYLLLPTISLDIKTIVLSGFEVSKVSKIRCYVDVISFVNEFIGN